MVTMDQPPKIGGYAQLSNIGNDHCYREDRTFVTAGVETHHAKGTYTRALSKWVEMRKKAEENNNEKVLNYLLQFIDIFQQPSGFEDAIISKWIIEIQGKHYPVSLHQRDMFTGCLTESSRGAMFLAQQFPSWIAGKMTPCCQITDSDVVFPVKAQAKIAEDNVRREFKSIADENNDKVDWSCGPYEILRISAEAIINSKADFDGGGILSAGVRNGQLSWRPNLLTRRLERTDKQQWCMDLKNKKGEAVRLGSHRIQNAWLEERHQWL
jgi:hypothetical protein